MSHAPFGEPDPAHKDLPRLGPHTDQAPGEPARHFGGKVASVQAGEDIRAGSVTDAQFDVVRSVPSGLRGADAKGDRGIGQRAGAENRPDLSDPCDGGDFALGNVQAVPVGTVEP
ncbi:hypothetical protein GCM10010320_74740 [Streptomyces caelestis]|nr:hypothetical protein GCM10010320_74740 [Streptomyces caelestis]